MFSVSRMKAGLKTFLAAASLLAATTLTAQAQEITPEHLNAARAAMKSTGATERLDKILPELAAFTKTGLIANRPDIEAEISTVVDEVAISLAERRGPLEEEAAGVYAKIFSQEELEKIVDFFGSEAGTKFLRATPILFRQVDQVSKVWRAGVARDMSKQVAEKLKEAGLQ